MERVIKYHIDHNKPITVSAFLKSHGYSSSLLKQIKQRSGGLLVSDEQVFTNHVLKSGDILWVKITDEKSSENIIPIDRELDIVFEDEDLLIINKPCGMPIHPVHQNRENTLANAVCGYYARQGLVFVFRAPHRLDKNTSGLMIVSKNLLSASILFDMVQRRQILREYLAIVRGVAPINGEITAPIARAKDSILERCVDFEKGEFAKTSYERLECVNGHSLLKVTLSTGRTHQIRVHLKHIGFPIVGDFLYCDDFTKIQRQALHSYHLSFLHPVTKYPLEFFCPMPQDMQSVLTR